MDVPHGACINEITVATAVVMLGGCWSTRVVWPVRMWAQHLLPHQSTLPAIIQMTLLGYQILGLMLQSQQWSPGLRIHLTRLEEQRQCSALISVGIITLAVYTLVHMCSEMKLATHCVYTEVVIRNILCSHELPLLWPKVGRGSTWPCEA